MPAYVSAMVTAAAQSMPLVVLCLSIHVSLGYLRFPDLSIPGSYLCGAYAFALVLILTGSSTLALAAAMAAGFFIGGLTAALHYFGRLNSLLAGLLVAALSTSIGGRIGFAAHDLVGGSSSARTSIITVDSNQVLPRVFLDAMSERVSSIIHPDSCFLQWGQAFACLGLALSGGLLLGALSGTQAGILVRAVGDNRPFSFRVGLDVPRIGTFGLAFAGMLSGVAGAIAAMVVGRVAVATDIGLHVIEEGFLSYFLGLVVASIGGQRWAPTSWARITVLSFAGAWMLCYVRAIVQSYASALPALEDTDYPAIFVGVVVASVYLAARRNPAAPQEEPLRIY